MLSLPAQRWILAIVLAASFACSLAILATRNIYDDELGSFEVIPHSVPDIWKTINAGDVHPPGTYVLSHWAWSATGDERWMTLFPLAALYVAMAVFAWRFGPYVAQTWSGYLLFLLLVLGHPQMLMWGNSIRWYPYWTSIALLLLAGAALRRRESYVEQPGHLRNSVLPGVAEGAVLALMFYLNYLTLIYAVALSAMIFLLWGWRQIKSAFLETVAAIATMALLTIPQWSPLIHIAIPNSANQRSSIFVSAARLAHGLLISEALLPWQPLAIAFFLIVVAPLVVFAVRFALQARPWLRDYWLSGFRQAPAVPIGVFAAIIVAAAVVTGIGYKARSFLILIPCLAVLAAAVCNQIRWPLARTVMLVVACLWVAAGATNLLLRQGTAKAGLNDRADEVVELVRRQADQKPAIIFCHDPLVAYSLDRAILQDRQPWSVCSFYSDFVHQRPACAIDRDDPAFVFVVHSYAGSLIEYGETWAELTSALNRAEQSLEDPQQARLSHDPDVFMKRRIPGMGVRGAQLPEDRFTVVWGRAKPGADWAAIAAEMRQVGDNSKRFHDQSFQRK